MQNRERINRGIDRLFAPWLSFLHGLVVECGVTTMFLFQSLRLTFKKPYRFNEIIRHIEFIGNRSLVIIALTGIFYRNGPILPNLHWISRC